MALKRYVLRCAPALWLSNATFLGGCAPWCSQTLCLSVGALLGPLKRHVLRGALALWLSNAMFYVVHRRFGSQMLRFLVGARLGALKRYVPGHLLHRRSWVLRENRARALHGLVLICWAVPAPPPRYPAQALVFTVSPCPGEAQNAMYIAKSVILEASNHQNAAYIMKSVILKAQTSPKRYCAAVRRRFAAGCAGPKIVQMLRV